MRNTIKNIVTLLLSTLALTSSAQVKQVFKVVDYNTRKPVVGATLELNMGGASQNSRTVTLKTNAQGIAVANLPAEMKGAYMGWEGWNLQGYTSFIAPESQYKFFQSSDTIKFYMVDLESWRGARRGMFLKIYQNQYDSLILPVARSIQDSIDDYIDKTGNSADRFVSSTFQSQHLIHDYYNDASSITQYALVSYDPGTFADVFQLLDKGDVNGAVAAAKSHIRMDDNSRQNLQWVELYLNLRDLNTSDEDEDTYCQYAKMLYENQYNEVSVLDYIRNLNREQQYSLADSVCAAERDKNKNPRWRDRFYPYFVRYMVEQDNAKLKTSAEDMLNIALDNYEKYPNSTMLSDVIWQYRVNYYAYAFLDDSVSATRTIDSAIAYTYRYIQDPSADNFAHNQSLIGYLYDILDAVSSNPDYYPEKSAFRLRDAIYRAAKENYENDTANIFLKLQLSECAVHWLQNYDEDMVEEADSFCSRMDVLKQLSDIDINLSARYPEYFAPQNVQVAVEWLTGAILEESDAEKRQDAFRRYEQSFDLVNAHFPKLFISKYLNFNRALESFFTTNQMFLFSDELAAFTERLIAMREDNDQKKILVAKAEYMNETAESLFQDESYEEAIGYYMQANEIYQQAIQYDEQQWIPFLRNYLQMGDAHLYQNQFDRAMLTYQKILDYESRIPANMMAQYITMKGNVNYYIGDVYRMTDDLKRAEKEYKLAEKWFLKAVAMGDSLAYHSLGEMYWGKAAVAAQQNNMKKCKQMVEKSVSYYEKCPMDRLLTRYERAKSTLCAFYEQDGATDKYYAHLSGLVDFYRKYVDQDEDYAIGLVQNAEKLINSGKVTNEEAYQYSQDILLGLYVLDDAGRDVELPYLRGLFYMGKMAAAIDSVEEAIDAYKRCAELSEQMYADTALTTHKGNMVDIYDRLATCYESMASDVDTAHSELWYYRAIDTRDTLIDLMKELNDDGDINLTYRTALQYRKNGMVFYHLEMVPSAQDYLDKSNELLLMLYNSEYKDEVEDDIIENYFFKGYIYSENHNEEKAIEYFRTAVEYGEKCESGSLHLFYMASISQLLEILEKDKEANAAEIAKLNKLNKELQKRLK